jgi:hypothetical protein
VVGVGHAPPISKMNLHLAKQATTSQLQRVVRAYHRATALNDLEAVKEIHEKRYFDYFFEESAFVLRGQLGRDDGSVVAKPWTRSKTSCSGPSPKTPTNPRPGNQT